MGTVYKTYAGCFLRVPVQNIPVTKRYYKTLSGKRANTRFNPETGEEYELCTEIVNEKTNPHSYIDDVDGFYEDAFDTAGEYNEVERLFIPNSWEDSIIKSDTEWEYDQSLLNVNSATEILRFKSKYSKYLDYYSKEFGKYEIDFGIIRYGS